MRQNQWNLAQHGTGGRCLRGSLIAVAIAGFGCQAASGPQPASGGQTAQSNAGMGGQPSQSHAGTGGQAGSPVPKPEPGTLNGNASLLSDDVRAYSAALQSDL